MSSNENNLNQKNDLFDEIILKVSTDAYLDDLGECLEQKKQELLNNDEYSMPTESFKEFKKYYRKKKKNTIKRVSSAYFSHTKRVACLIGIALIVFTSNANSIKAFRIKILDFFIEQKEKFTTIQLKLNRDSSYLGLPKEWDSWYYPKYIPDKFKVLEANKYSNFGEIIYINSKGIEVTFTFDLNDTSLVIDTEDAIIDEILIKNRPAQMITKNNYTTIVFEYEGVFFTVAGSISKRTLVEIAESIEK